MEEDTKRSNILLANKEGRITVDGVEYVVTSKSRKEK